MVLLIVLLVISFFIELTVELLAEVKVFAVLSVKQLRRLQLLCLKVGIEAGVKPAHMIKVKVWYYLLLSNK